MKVALYPRVSSVEQAEGYSIGEQIERLTKYCEAMGWEIYKIYTDPGYSGGNLDRPGLQKMLKDIRAGKVGKVVVYKLDRLSRSQKDTMMLIEDEFLSNGVDFVSISENFDTTTPYGRAMIGLLAVFAQLERENIKERTMIGKEARAKDGKWHGGSTVPVGYDYNQATDELTINEYEAMQVNELYDLYIAGTPLRTIERVFMDKGYRHKYGPWDPNTMRRVMRNKTNIGYIRHRSKWYKGDHMPIVAVEKYKHALRLLNDRAEKFRQACIKPGAQTTYLGGLLYCKHCGGKYAKQAGRKWKNNTPPIYYTCYSRSKKVPAMVKDPSCRNKNWRMEELNAIVFEEIRKLAMDPDAISSAREENLKTTDTPDKIAIIENEIAKLDVQISRFMDLYGAGGFTVEQVSSKVDPLNAQRKALENEMEALTAATSELSDEEAKELVQSFDDVLARGDFDEIRLVIDTLISRIELDEDKVQIFWNFY